jgi:transposase
MDRSSLEQLLNQGLSLADIAKRFGRHESTVAYWVRKHGLRAVHDQRHAARGRLTKEQLAALVEREMSIAEIASAVGRSKGTVPHWLRRYGLQTYAQQGCIGRRSTRAAKAEGKATVMRRCRRHGMTEFWLEGRGYYRCKRCRMDRVSQRRRKIKLLLVAEAGGRCALCGYDRCVSALHFHHLDPTSKRFHLSMQGVTRSLGAARAEMAKCALLCANCHAEVEAGVATLPLVVQSDSGCPRIPR